MSQIIDAWGDHGRDDSITPRRAVSKWRMIEAEARLAALIESHVDGFVLFDDLGLIQDMNPTAQRMFGWKLAEVEGIGIGTLMRDDVQGDYLARFNAYRDGDGSIEPSGQAPVFLAKHRDGSTIPVRTNLAEVKVGGRRHFLVAIRDLSRENQMAKSIERFFRVAEEVSELVVITSLDGTIVAANRPTRQLNSLLDRVDGDRRDMTRLYTFDRSSRLRISDLMTSESQAAFRAAVLPTIDQHRSWTGELSFVSDDERVTTFSVVVLCHLDAYGEPEMLSITGQDLSQTIAAAQARELARLKDEFVSTVSHELRTPLTSVIGALRIVESGLLGDLTPEVHEVLAVAATNAHHLARLIDDLLHLNSLTHGKRVRTEEIVLSEIIEDAVYNLRNLANDAGIRISFEPSSFSDTIVLGDRLRLTQVLINLVSNAIKFSPTETTIVIRCTSGGKGMVLVSISDQGIGIPIELRDRIFEPFVQVSTGRARTAGGSGLGLPICKSIVEQHGGEMSVESSEGEGSTFYFSLPLRPDHGIGRGDQGVPAGTPW